jgi:hypothetical protein
MPPPPGVASGAPPPGSPAGWTVPTAPGAVDRSALAARNRLSGLLAVIGGAVVILGSFLPWASLSGDDTDVITGMDSSTITGWTTIEGETGDGPIFLVLGLAVAIMAILALRGIVNLGTKIATIVVASISLLISLAEFGDVSDANDIVKPFGFEFSYGVGLFLLLAGSILGIVGGALFKRTAA